jgi:hypothetical protein
VGRWVVVAGLVLSGCRGERTHPRLAELTTPFHVTVRAIDLPSDCEGLSGLERLRCNTERPRGGCTFVAVGPDADLPLAFSGPMKKEHCDEQRTRHHTVLVASGALKSARLFIDPRGERVVVHLDSDGWVLFVHDGKLVGSKQLWGAGVVPLAPLLADGSPDWPRVPTLLSTWDSASALLSGLTLQDVMRDDPAPQENLTLALLGDSFRFDSPRFSEGFELLDAPHREKVVEAALDQVKGGADFSGWFRTQKDLLPRYREALLVALRDDSLFGASLLNDVAAADPVALRDVACGELERMYLGGNLDEGGMPSKAALALIARQKLKCPWVLPWLRRLQCDGRLTCVEETEFDDHQRRAPLCTGEQIEATVNQMFHEPTEDELVTPDEFEPDDHFGELLLGAAAAQGTLPAEFIRRTQRRAYEGVEPPECTNLFVPTGAWVCLLPVELTVSTQGRCRMTVDDAKQQLRFEELPAPPSGALQRNPFLPAP